MLDGRWGPMLFVGVCHFYPPWGQLEVRRWGILLVGIVDRI